MAAKSRETVAWVAASPASARRWPIPPGADETGVQKLGEQMAAGVSGHRCKIKHNGAKLCKSFLRSFRPFSNSNSS